MKRFIAFHNNSNSGIQTEEKAVEWANDMLNRTNVSKIHLCEVVEVVERTTPPTRRRPYVVVSEENTSKPDF